LQTRINKPSDCLFQITLSPPIKGFQGFICCWIYRNKSTFLIDPGPAVTITSLIAALDELCIRNLDYILLTHIHVDHAGGIGDLADRFPDTPIVCHSSAISHLIDPERLWKGTVKTLGETGRAYGKIKPVPANQLIEVKHLDVKGVKAIPTPGHAPHHVSFIADQYLFAGETGGVRLLLPSGQTYLRPATPPRFFLETSLSSIDKLITTSPENICYGHYGMY
jgi:glyoxylase-like metal-dependent hydrolase (beta-lactamase superfamily II)